MVGNERLIYKEKTDLKKRLINQLPELVVVTNIKQISRIIVLRLRKVSSGFEKSNHVKFIYVKALLKKKNRQWLR